MPEGVSSFLPGFPSDVSVVDDASYAPFVVTMPNGEDLAAAINARATGEQHS